jgi:hypothetical protein
MPPFLCSHSHEMEVQPEAVRDWSELPLDVLALVFAKLGAVDILMGAGLVCHSWLEAAKVPSLWRYVDMEHHDVLRGKKKKSRDVLCAMAKAAVDRSNGELEVFAGSEFVTDQLLKYIAERYSCFSIIFASKFQIRPQKLVVLFFFQAKIGWPLNLLGTAH